MSTACHGLMVNANSREISIPSVLIDGSPLSRPTFHKEAIYGTDANSSEITQDEGDSGTIVLKPYSVNLIRF
ncbi:MAG: hypothetical protein NTW86_32255 [Candidatus Sumerlaeota bacterium]|nr:hypothetical protein [Candidatus Sumerlaeota bacterium]